MIPPRELEVDIAYALGQLAFVEVGYALDPHLYPTRATHPDAFLYAVTLRPYTIDHLVEAHYALLAVVTHDITGRVLYADAAWELPTPLRRARRLTLTREERNQAALRARRRAEDVERVRRLEAEAVRSSGALRLILGGRAENTSVAAPLDSGVFEIVADPFPSLKRKPARVLVLDEDLATVASVKALAEEVKVEQPESADWSAIEPLLRGDYDLVLCALRFGGWSGAQLYRLVAQNNPTASARVVFVTDVAPNAPPASARGRVLAKPLDLDELRRLLYARRAAD